MGSAILFPFGFSSYSYSSGVRISWWKISLACPGYCTQTVIVFLGKCQGYKSLKFNSIIIINDYHYSLLSLLSIIIFIYYHHYIIASLIVSSVNLEAVDILCLYWSWYAIEYNRLSVMAEVCPGMGQFFFGILGLWEGLLYLGWSRISDVLRGIISCSYIWKVLTRGKWAYSAFHMSSCVGFLLSSSF